VEPLQNLKFVNLTFYLQMLLPGLVYIIFLKIAKGMIVSDVMENMYTMTFKISRMAHVLLTYMF
jgi:hypothetical protein